MVEGVDAFENPIVNGDLVTRVRRTRDKGGIVLVLCRVVGFTSNGQVRVEEIATSRHPGSRPNPPRGGIFAVAREQVAKYAAPGVNG